MTGLYYTDMLDVLRAAGLTCRESSTTNGWQQRARSSGGFPAAPLCVFWHHTASSTSPANDLAYMIDGSDDAPVGNMLIDREGCCWPIAAGASNCAGKGGPAAFSRGTVPLDQGNTRGWQIEVANAGTGEPWPEVQVSAFIAASNALNARFGNLPTDVITHALGAGDGYTDRKIDPATAAAVQGAWRPRSTNSSGTWSLADVRAECARRYEEDDDMALSDADVQRIAAAVWGHMLSGERAGYPDGPAQVFLVDGRRDAAVAATRDVGADVWWYNVEGDRAGYPDTAAQVFLVDGRRDAATAVAQTAPQ